MPPTYPRILSVVLDTTDARSLAVLTGPEGLRLAFQQVADLPRSTWPEPDVPQQLHLDTAVDDRTELDRHHERALALGATLLRDRSDDPEEPLRVYADPQGHPFCLFVG